jgi:uncharacterized protein DUF5719
VDHEEVLPDVRGRALVALLAVAAVVVGAITLDGVQPKALGTAEPVGASSGSWFCPHGGGKGWHGELSLTNPSSTPVMTRVTDIGAKGSSAPRTVTVPASSSIRISMDSSSAESATQVEYFDGWVAVAWSSIAGGGDSGIAAEGCEPTLSRTWFVPDGTTVRGETGWIVVMNPAAADAIFAIRLLTEQGVTQPPPWSDLVLRPGRSAAFDIAQYSLDKRTVSAVVQAKIGRVAVASVGVSAQGGVRAADGIPALMHSFTLPGGPDAGRTDLVVANPGSGKATYHGTLDRTDGSQAIGQLNGESLRSGQATTYEITTNQTATIQFTATSNTGVAVARRTVGPQGDAGAIVGGTPATAWVIPAGTTSSNGVWKLSLANPGTAPAQVHLQLLDAKGPTSAAQTVKIPAGRTVLIGVSLTKPAPEGAVVAVATSGTFVPMATSFTRDVSGYATSMGEPVPTQWVGTLAR